MQDETLRGFSDEIRRADVSGLPGDDVLAGVARPSIVPGVLVPEVTAEQRRATRLEDDFRWYEKIRIKAWAIGNEWEIVKLLLEIISQLKEGTMTKSSIGVIASAILGFLLGIPKVAALLPGVTPETAVSTGQTIWAGASAAVASALAFLHSVNAARAKAAAETTNGLPSKLQP